MDSSNDLVNLSVFILVSFLPVLATGGVTRSLLATTELTDSSSDPKTLASAVVVGVPLSPELRMEPYFAEEDFTSSKLVRNETFHAGETAFLECQVRNLGAKRVSWVRHRDVHILAVGGHVFTSDDRFEARAFEDDSRFILSIRNISENDEGAYECQISTKPTKVFVINLNVEVASTRIIGDPAIHVEKSSDLSITCSLTAQQHRSVMAPKLFWYKDGKILDMKVGGRGRIVESRVNSTVLLSHFSIDRVDLDDSGNYSCRSSTATSADSASVKVHVLLDGESPNAWKTNSALTFAASSVLLMMPTTFLAWLS